MIKDNPTAKNRSSLIEAMLFNPALFLESKGVLKALSENSKLARLASEAFIDLL